MNYRLLMMLIAALAILSCNNSTDTKMAASKYKTIGTIDRIDPAVKSGGHECAENPAANGGRVARRADQRDGLGREQRP